MLARENRKMQFHTYRDYMNEFISSTLKTRNQLAYTKSVDSKTNHKCSPFFYHLFYTDA